MPINIDDLLDILHPSDAQLSPDGSQIAYVLGKSNIADKDTPYEKAIWLVDVATGTQRRLAPS